MIPILGQQFSILGYTLVPTLQCQCERKGVVTLTLQQNTSGVHRLTDQCGACGRIYNIQAVTATADGRLQFGIEVGTPVPTPVLMD